MILSIHNFNSLNGNSEIAFKIYIPKYRYLEDGWTDLQYQPRRFGHIRSRELLSKLEHLDLLLETEKDSLV